MLITPPSSLLLLSSLAAEDWMATVHTWLVTVALMFHTAETKLTGRAQSHHAALSKPKDDNLARRIPTLVNQNLSDQDAEQLGAFLQARVGVEPASRRVENDIIAPVRSLQVEKRFRPTDRNTSRFGQVQLLAEGGEGVVAVS
jgi:hypothetical protein